MTSLPAEEFLSLSVPERLAALKDSYARMVQHMGRIAPYEIRKFIHDNEAQIATLIVQRRRQELQVQLNTFNYKNCDSFLDALQHYLHRRGLWLVDNKWDAVGFDHYYTEVCDGKMQDVDDVYAYASRLVYLHLWKHTPLRPNMWPNIEALKTEILNLQFSTPWGRADPRRRTRAFDMERVLANGLTGVAPPFVPAAPHNVVWGTTVGHQPFPFVGLTEVKPWVLRNLNEPRRRNESTYFMWWDKIYEWFNVPRLQDRRPNGVMSTGPAVAYGVSVAEFDLTKYLINAASAGPLARAAVLDRVFIW